MSTKLIAAEIIDLYSQGYTDIEVIKAMGITRKQFEREYQVNKIFRDIVDRGRDYCEAWHYEQSRTKLGDKDFNVSLYSKRMDNVFGWSTKVETKNANINAEINSEDVAARLSALLPNVMHLLPKEKQEELKRLTQNKEVDGEYQQIASDE